MKLYYSNKKNFSEDYEIVDGDHYKTVDRVEVSDIHNDGFGGGYCFVKLIGSYDDYVIVRKSHGKISIEYCSPDGNAHSKSYLGWYVPESQRKIFDGIEEAKLKMKDCCNYSPVEFDGNKKCEFSETRIYEEVTKSDIPDTEYYIIAFSYKYNNDFGEGRVLNYVANDPEESRSSNQLYESTDYFEKAHKFSSKSSCIDWINNYNSTHENNEFKFTIVKIKVSSEDFTLVD